MHSTLESSRLSRRGVLAGVAGAGLTGVAVTGVGLTATPAAADGGNPTTPTAALARLLDGNLRFRTGHGRRPRQDRADIRRLAAGQDPFVVVLGCADSRVPAEILFDQGLGDVFDNRVAGNVVDPAVIGSIEYAVAEFAPPLIVVLGHERCGAVLATIETIEHHTSPPGSIGALVEAIRPAVEPVLHHPGDTVENGVRANVRHQVGRLLAGSAAVRDARASGALAVVGARYDLDTAAVTLVH